MKNKNLAGVKLFWCFVINILVITNCFSEGIDEEAIFEERLVQWVTSVDAMIVEGDNEGNLKKAVELSKDLQNFYQEYPDNKYSDDARFIICYLLYGPVIELEPWEELVEKYPGGKIEEFTKERLRVLQDYASGFVYHCSVPFDLILTYVKGEVGLRNEDYEEAAKHLSEFVKKLDYNTPDLKEVLKFAYRNLLESYKKLNDRNNYEEVKKRMITLFPESQGDIQDYWPLPIPE